MAAITSETKITDTVFVNNQAAERGGAIVHFQWEGPGTEITNSVFRGNEAAEGGAIYKSKPTPLTIQGSEFDNNTPDDFGGLEKNLIVQDITTPPDRDALDPLPKPPAPPKVLDPLPKPPAPPKVIPEPVEDVSEPPSLPEPVVNLNLNETTGRIAADSSQQGLDNSGTLVGDVQWTDGIKQGAVTFDGPEDFIHLSSSQDINLGIHSQRTLSLWLKADNLLSPGGQKQVVYEEGGHVRGLNVYIDQERLYVGGWNTPTDESGWEGTWLSTDQLVAGEWNHVALVLDGDANVTDGAIHGYLNGEKFGTGAGSQLWEHSDSIGLGNINNGTRFHDGLTGSGHGFSVALDEVMIFNNALSDHQIQVLAE
ncbi:MAG: LamG domain-containing protein [Leptolyngbya sp. SIO1D8]|nr:LamG domain-containing protein [Leptolyngbya sp. SIO1D8]